MRRHDADADRCTETSKGHFIRSSSADGYRCVRLQHQASMTVSRFTHVNEHEGGPGSRRQYLPYPYQIDDTTTCPRDVEIESRRIRITSLPFPKRSRRRCESCCRSCDDARIQYRPSLSRNFRSDILDIRESIEIGTEMSLGDLINPSITSQDVKDTCKACSFVISNVGEIKRRR